MVTAKERTGRVDGVVAAELGLPGKPAPDTFLEAARRLGVEPGRAVVVEDAIVGVQAGRAGGFGLVIGVDRVLLVTHSWHMRRAILAFEAHGFQVVPAPTMFHGVPPEGLDGWTPSAKALRHTSWALHEWIGRLYYSTREP